MDALYLYRHSPNSDFEIRYSLRSLGRYAPYIRKVWIFGDRPRFLTKNRSLAECVPHDYIAPLFGVSTPLHNFFLMMFLSSLIPDLSFEYLRFSDDFFLMREFPIEQARRDRYQEDLAKVKNWREGEWVDALRRTGEVLVRLGYPAYNFEIHAPMYLTRKRVLEAYRDLCDYVTEDQLFGLAGATAILNHSAKHEKLDLVSLADEDSRFGFWGSPPKYEEIVAASTGKLFFNFDDYAFGPAIQRFLMEVFQEPSKYESPGA
jgi:hypothetical protein